MYSLIIFASYHFDLLLTLFFFNVFFLIFGFIYCYGLLPSLLENGNHSPLPMWGNRLIRILTLVSVALFFIFSFFIIFLSPRSVEDGFSDKLMWQKTKHQEVFTPVRERELGIEKNFIFCLNHINPSPNGRQQIKEWSQQAQNQYLDSVRQCQKKKSIACYELSTTFEREFRQQWFQQQSMDGHVPLRQYSFSEFSTICDER